MDLPSSVAAIGERLGGDDAIVVDPQLLTGADVFAAERERLFARPWVAVEHHSRIDQPGRYVRVDAATRSILLSRDSGGRLRALRNLCLHAGYPICEAEQGPSDRLVCLYHGWEYAADGLLVEPDLSARIDPARLRLQSHPVCVQDGLVFVDLSRPAAASAASDPAPVGRGAVPDWLAEAEVTRRARYNTEWNWKLALQYVKASPHLVCDDPDAAELVAFGPLSFMMVEAHQAALLQVIPKAAGLTDVNLIRMAPQGTPAPADGPDRLARGLREAGDGVASPGQSDLDREFLGWYWSLMSPG